MPGAWTGRMTIQPPPDEMPSTPPDDDREDSSGEPEQRAPGADQPPMGAPRDEPDDEA